MTTLILVDLKVQGPVIVGGGVLQVGSPESTSSAGSVGLGILIGIFTSTALGKVELIDAAAVGIAGVRGGVA